MKLKCIILPALLCAGVSQALADSYVPFSQKDINLVPSTSIFKKLKPDDYSANKNETIKGAMIFYDMYKLEILRKGESPYSIPVCFKANYISAIPTENPNIALKNAIKNTYSGNLHYMENLGIHRYNDGMGVLLEYYYKDSLSGEAVALHVYPYFPGATLNDGECDLPEGQTP